MNLFNITIHAETPTLEWLEPLARHLGHIELALDYNGQQPREPHPAVVMIDEIEREEARAKRVPAHVAKAKREADRKRKERDMMRVLSPKVIAAVPCQTCGAGVKRPCRGPSGTEFGFTGHTHFARRKDYQDVTS